MKTVNKLAVCALLAPAFTLGAGSVYAQATTQDRAQEQRTTQDRGYEQRGAEDTQRPGATTQPGTTQPGTAQPGQRQPGATGTTPGTTPGTAQRPGERMDHKAGMTGKHLSRAPANAFHADWLIGQDVKSQTGDDDVGTISDLVIDEDGQVLAVIVGVGGFLGVGERDVAISWDALQHTRDSDGDAKFTTNMTRDSLRDAPEYDRDAN